MLTSGLDFLFLSTCQCFIPTIMTIKTFVCDLIFATICFVGEIFNMTLTLNRKANFNEAFYAYISSSERNRKRTIMFYPLKKDIFFSFANVEYGTFDYIYNHYSSGIF